MKTLIVPCAGRSMLHDKPKYLARHPEGKLLVQKCIEGIPAEAFDRILFTILHKDADAYQSDRIILDSFEEMPVEVVVLQEETSGPAETVYQTLRMAHVQGAVVIKDCDNFLRVDNLEYRNFAAGLDLNEWDRDVHQLRNKSFLILNEQKQILDVFEKQFKSDVICLGLYGFGDTEDFITAYEKLNNSCYPIQKLYVSHIISYLIGYSQRVFRYVPCTEYENWGNEKVWNDVQKAYTTYFVDLDNVTADETSMKQMATLFRRGAKLVGFTVHGEESKNALIVRAAEYGFVFLDIVCGASYSSIKRVVKNSSDLAAARYEM